jgi:stress-induced-phosphoprotein 1
MLGSDPRMIDVLGALMGIDMQGFSRPEGSDEVPFGVPRSAASPPSSPPPSAAPAPASSSKVHEPEDAKMAEAEEAEAEEDEDAAVKAAAEADKKLGADAYKKRDFAAAITHFSKAWETWPKDVTFLTNLAGGQCWSCSRMLWLTCVLSVFACAAAYFEQGDYDKSIEACQKAVEEGREVIPPFYQLMVTMLAHVGVFLLFLFYVSRFARITSSSQKRTAVSARPMPKRTTWPLRSGSSRNL